MDTESSLLETPLEPSFEEIQKYSSQMDPEINNLDAPLPPPEEDHTQSDFIQKELNFDIDPDDPLTKASLSDHPVDEWMDILGSGQLRKKVLKAGRPHSRPNRSDICTVKFTGTLEDGTVVEEEDDFIMQLGDMEVIQVGMVELDGNGNFNSYSCGY